MQLVEHRYKHRQRCDTSQVMAIHVLFLFSLRREEASKQASDREAGEENNERNLYLIPCLLGSFDCTPFRPPGQKRGWLSAPSNKKHRRLCRMTSRLRNSFGTVLIESSRMSLLVRGASAKLRAVARRCELQLHVCGQAIFRTSPEPHK